MIKLVALDLDGTTLNCHGMLSDVTKETFIKAMEKGVHVVIATGRCFTALPKEIVTFEGIEYAITSNGAHISKVKDGETIYTNCINESAIEQAYDILKELPYMIEIFVDGKAYLEKDIYEKIVTGGITFRHMDYVKNTRIPTLNALEFMLENKGRVENINIFFDSDEDKANTLPILETLDNVTITSSLKNNWEIGGKTTSKAEAIRALCKIINIEKTEILACGDSPNDKEMLLLAEIPIAVANAVEEIKEVAVHVTDSNDNDGVAKALEKFVLKETSK